MPSLKRFTEGEVLLTGTQAQSAMQFLPFPHCPLMRLLHEMTIKHKFGMDLPGTKLRGQCP